MEAADVIRAIDWCENLLGGYGFEPRRHPATDTPTNDYEAGAHAMWMCGEVRRFVKEGREQKAHRWLGFVQGVIFCASMAPVEHMKDVNRPREGG